MTYANHLTSHGQGLHVCPPQVPSSNIGTGDDLGWLAPEGA